MEFGLLSSNPVPVAEVIADPTFDNQHIAVHGVIYYGERCEKDEILLLPKDGPFNGDPIRVPASIDRQKCLLMEQPNLYHDLRDKMGKFAMCGGTLWNVDAIVVGRISRHPGSSHLVRVGELWLIVAQDWLDIGNGKFSHKFSVCTFPQNKLPQLPWKGVVGSEWTGSLPAIAIQQ